MVFEGEKTEKIIFDNLKKYFLHENPNTIVYGFHCGEIYSLYHKLEKDEDLKLFSLLKEKLQTKNPELSSIQPSQVSEIYMFFDYDSHASGAEIDKLKAMINLFDNETENGKLYISYPMVEAIKHLKTDVDFKDTVAISQKEYKKIVLENCDNSYKLLRDLSHNDWSVIISENCKKLGFIMTDNFEFLNSFVEQIEILQKQEEKYIINNHVAVLSAFPIFLVDYYGYEKIREMIKV